MVGGLILFIVEGPSDQDALLPFITKEIYNNKIRTTIKIMHGDLLTAFAEGTRNFSTIPANVRGQVEKMIKNYLSDPATKLEQIKAKDINKVYYVTDMDDCYFSQARHSINKRNCLNYMFNFNEIKVSEKRLVPFELIFFSKKLEVVIDNNYEDLSDEEKEKIAIEFSEKSLKDRSFFIDTFKCDELKTWESYRESYNGIKEYRERSCNMNNFLDEIEEWKSEI